MRRLWWILAATSFLSGCLEGIEHGPEEADAGCPPKSTTCASDLECHRQDPSLFCREIHFGSQGCGYRGCQPLPDGGH